MSPTQQRDRAIELARTDSVAARQAAAVIDNPWFRAQAQAWIAWLGPAESCTTLLAESRASALAAEDPYQVVGAAAWPVRAAVERNFMTEALATLDAIMPISDQIENAVSRVGALFLLWQASVGLPSATRAEVLNRMLAAGTSADSWRIGDTLREVALMLGNEDLAAAHAVVERMPDGQYRRQATTRLANQQYVAPRPFFWHSAEGK